jgi:hypothetical protein
MSFSMSFIFSLSKSEVIEIKKNQELNFLAFHF